jgi:hypothetical protein
LIHPDVAGTIVDVLILDAGVGIKPKVPGSRRAWCSIGLCGPGDTTPASTDTSQLASVANEIVASDVTRYCDKLCAGQIGNYVGIAFEE